MDEFPSIILDMHVMNPETVNLAIYESLYATIGRDRMIELGDLVSHRKIRIKITLPIKDTPFLHST
jgi:hypothetical protein